MSATDLRELGARRGWTIVVLDLEDGRVKVCAVAPDGSYQGALHGVLDVVAPLVVSVLERWA